MKRFGWLFFIPAISMVAQAGVSLYYVLLVEANEETLRSFACVNSAWGFTNAGLEFVIALRLYRLISEK